MSIHHPQCFVEIYPTNATGNQSGSYVLSGTEGHILSCSVQKDITQTSGTFSLTLAPGFNGNPDATWANIVTPMSLVLIGMQRAGRSTIVMVGVVTGITEGTAWGHQGVQRVTTITGTDMSYFFTNFSYFALGFLGATAGTQVGEAVGIGDLSSAKLLNMGFLAGTPQQIGVNFIEQVMFGKSFGLMQKTKVNYIGNNTIPLGEVFGINLAEYTDAVIWFDADFVTTEQDWYAKFQNIFPSPWYEFFIITGPQSTVRNPQPWGADVQQPGFPFVMQSLPQAPAVQATIVARVNPMPVLQVTAPAQGFGASITGLDQSKWDALTLFQADEDFPRQSAMQFGIGSLANFFGINPVNIGSMYGNGNSIGATILLAMETACDPSSIIDYGYRPAILPTVWLGDASGANSQNPNIYSNFSQVSAGLIARIISTLGPQALMASAVVTLPLRPDILPGNKFEYSPFKYDNQPWQFYIQGVSHNFVFGGESTTTLTLMNGLPSAIYEPQQTQIVALAGSPLAKVLDSGATSVNSGGVTYGPAFTASSLSNTTLQDILSGKAVRAEGQYFTDSARTGVQFFGPSSDIQSVLSEISSGFSNPGGTAPN